MPRPTMAASVMMATSSALAAELSPMSAVRRSMLLLLLLLVQLLPFLLPLLLVLLYLRLLLSPPFWVN